MVTSSRVVTQRFCGQMERDPVVVAGGQKWKANPESGTTITRLLDHLTKNAHSFPLIAVDVSSTHGTFSVIDEDHVLTVDPSKFV